MRYLYFLLWVLLLGKAQAAEPLNIVYDEVFPPFTYADEDGRAKGLHVEILSGMLDAARIPYRLTAMPWKRVVALTDMGRLDISLPFRHQPERFEKYHMIGPLTPTGSRTFVFTLKQREIPWRGFSELKNFRIGLIDGFSYPQEVSEATGLEIYRLNGSTRALAQLMLLGRVDVLVSDETVFWRAAAFHGKQHFRPLGKPLDRTYRYFVVPRDHPALAARMQQLFDSYRQSRVYETILARHNLSN